MGSIFKQLSYDFANRSLYSFCFAQFVIVLTSNMLQVTETLQYTWSDLVNQYL